MKKAISLILILCIVFCGFGNIGVLASSTIIGGITSGDNPIITGEDVERVETFPAQMIENTFGHWLDFTDEETGESGEYFCYDWSSFIGYRIYLKNGDVIETDDGYFNYNGVNYPLTHFHSHKSYENRWELGGTYTEQIEILGEEYDLEISIVESPVVSIRCEVDEIVIRKGTYCNVINEGDVPLYRYRWYEAANWIATFKDGGEQTTYNRIFEIDGHNYHFEFIDGQATLENWEVGKTYGVKAKFLGAECDVQVKITDSPIKKIEFGDIYVYENADGNWNTHRDWDENREIEYFRYNWMQYIPYTVTYLDGTTYSGKGDYLYYNDEYFGFETSDTQLWNNEWKAGNTYPVQIGVAGEKYTANVTVKQSPVESVNFADIVIPQGLSGRTYTEYDALLNKEFTYFRYEPQEFIDYAVTFVGGTNIEGYKYGFTYDNRSYGISIKGGSQDHNNVWIPDNTYYITVSIMGVETVVPVYIKPVTEAEGFGYSRRYDNTVCIEECSKTDERLVIPEKFGDYTVSEISSLDIAEDYIKEICIPESIETLSWYDFSKAQNLTTIYYQGSQSEWQDISHHYMGYGDIEIVYNYSDPLWKLDVECEECRDFNGDMLCDICGEPRETSHEYKPATCEDPKICKKCGDTTGEALGHTGGTATCKAKAKCTRCGERYGSVDSNVHIKFLIINGYAPTCKNNGLTNGEKCADCGKVTVAQKTVAKKSHTYKTTTKPATEKANGKIEKKCTVCGNVSSSKVIRKISSVKLSEDTYTYNGKTKTPTVTVKDSAGNKLVKNTDYTVKYATGRKNVGKHKVTITFKGKYSGTKTLSFTINPTKTTVSKLTAGKKSIKVNITKKSSQVTGYEVQYSTSKTFKSAKTKTISSYKTTSTTLKNLSAKKTYYVRVRTYKTANGTKYYSGWSSYKRVKTK